MPSLLGFVFATRWSTPSLHLGHPLWRPATTFTTAAREAFQNDDAFLDLLSLAAKLGQHFVDVHLRSLPAQGVSTFIGQCAALAATHAKQSDAVVALAGGSDYDVGTEGAHGLYLRLTAKG
jgi:hypothetical protein